MKNRRCNASVRTLRKTDDVVHLCAPYEKTDDTVRVRAPYEKTDDTVRVCAPYEKTDDTVRVCLPDTLRCFVVEEPFMAPGKR